MKPNTASLHCAEFCWASYLNPTYRTEGEVDDSDIQGSLQVKWNFTGRHFRARGDCAITAGLDKQLIREYIKNQEREEKH